MCRYSLRYFDYVSQMILNYPHLQRDLTDQCVYLFSPVSCRALREPHQSQRAFPGFGFFFQAFGWLHASHISSPFLTPMGTWWDTSNSSLGNLKSERHTADEVVKSKWAQFDYKPGFSPHEWTTIIIYNSHVLRGFYASR